MCGVYALGNLVEVAAVPAHEREKLAQLREVELQDAPVYGHLAQVGAEVFRDEFSLTVYSDDATVSISFPWPYLKNSASVVSINEDEGDGGVNVDKRIVASYDEAYRSEWTELVKCFRENREPELNADGAAADIAIFEKMIQKFH